MQPDGARLYPFSRLHPGSRQSQIDMSLPRAKIATRFPRLVGAVLRNVSLTISLDLVCQDRPTTAHKIERVVVTEQECSEVTLEPGQVTLTRRDSET